VPHNSARLANDHQRTHAIVFARATLTTTKTSVATDALRSEADALRSEAKEISFRFFGKTREKI
jgi:hypothetical protein